MTHASVVALHLNVGSREPLVAVSTVTAQPGRGLDDKRHRRANRSILLMEQDVLEQFGLAPGSVREQVTVRGLSLAGLAPATRLRVGTAVLEAGGMCAPCERMNEVQPGLRAALEGRRGRFFRVVEAGAFAVGDPITILAADRSPAA